MTVPTSIDPGLPWIEQIDRAEPDLLRAMLKTFVQTLMSAEAAAICGAPFGAHSQDRVNTRNGYRAARVGHPSGHDRTRDPQVALGVVPPGPAA